jgi:hypothetical protein
VRFRSKYHAAIDKLTRVERVLLRGRILQLREALARGFDLHNWTSLRTCFLCIHSHWLE